MKSRLPLFIFTMALVLLSTFKPLFADADRFTGEEWFSMPEDSRSEFVSMAKQDLEGDGVPLGKSLDEYVSEVNDFFKTPSGKSPRSVSVVLPALVYSSEPKAKQVMDDLIQKKKMDKIEKF